MTTVYEICHVADNPLYEGLILDWDDVEIDVFAWRRPDWTPPLFAPKWKFPTAIGQVRRFNDYPCINGIVPAFSERAVDLLRDLLEPNGELLPVRHKVGMYYFFNCRHVVDCADLEKSEVDRVSGGVVTSTNQLVLRDEALSEDLSVFKIRTQFSQVFCTDRFVARVAEAGLHGFVFPQLWPPLPDGTPFQHESTRLQRLAEKWKPKVGPELEITQNSVVIRLYHSRKSATKKEGLAVDQVVDELEKALYDEDQQEAESYFGNFERSEECDYEVRVYLTTPDCDRLVSHLLPLLKNLPWPGKYHVAKKRAEYIDEQASEEYVRLD